MDALISLLENHGMGQALKRKFGYENWGDGSIGDFQVSDLGLCLDDNVTDPYWVARGIQRVLFL